MGFFLTDLLGIGDAPGTVDPKSVYNPAAPELGRSYGFGHTMERQGEAAMQRGMQLGYYPRGAPQAQAAQGQAAQLQGGQMYLGGLAEQGTRSQQQTNLGTLQAAAAGDAPSAAQAQLRQGLDASIRAQMSLANSGRGAGADAMQAQRMAASQGARMQLAAQGQSAMLRAQEQAQARGMYTDALGQQRGQDQQRNAYFLQQAMGQAGMNQQMALANMNAQQQANMGNVGFQLQSRGLDDQSAQGYMRLGMAGTQQAAAQEMASRQMWMDFQQMMLNRSMGIQGVNADAETKRMGAQAGMIGAGISAAATK